MNEAEVKKIIVDLVKYDTEKTTGRKRKNLIVEAKTEASVIKKLEKIHKGDKVKEVFEIVWGEEEVDIKAPVYAHTGMVKFFEKVKGFGFIEPDNTDLEDLFFHASALGGETIYDEDMVEFDIGEGPQGPVAIHIRLKTQEDK